MTSHLKRTPLFPLLVGLKSYLRSIALYQPVGGLNFGVLTRLFDGLIIICLVADVAWLMFFVLSLLFFILPLYLRPYYAPSL